MMNKPIKTYGQKQKKYKKTVGFGKKPAVFCMLQKTLTI